MFSARFLRLATEDKQPYFFFVFCAVRKVFLRYNGILTQFFDVSTPFWHILLTYYFYIVIIF